jgi:transposase
MTSGKKLKISCPAKKETSGERPKIIVYLLRPSFIDTEPGIPWRDRTERLGDFRVVHTRYSRWAKKGVWQEVFQALAEDADNEYGMIDSTP